MQVRLGCAECSWSQLLENRGSRIERFEADLKSTGALVEDRLSFSFAAWAALGDPPPEVDDEAFDSWVLFQEVLFDALVGSQQTVAVHSEGYVGAAGASLQIRVNGKKLTRRSCSLGSPPSIGRHSLRAGHGSLACSESFGALCHCGSASRSTTTSRDLRSEHQSLFH